MKNMTVKNVLVQLTKRIQASMETITTTSLMTIVNLIVSQLFTFQIGLFLIQESRGTKKFIFRSVLFDGVKITPYEHCKLQRVLV